MINSTFRAVFRTPGACQFVNSYVIRSRINQLKGFRCYHGINLISKEALDKGTFYRMDWNKKRKSSILVWREISTQSNPSKEGSMELGKTEIDEAEAMVVSPSSTSCSDVLKDSEEVSGDSSATTIAQNIVGIQDKDKLTMSEKKHSVTLEVGSSVMRIINGKNGKDIEKDMGVKIKYLRDGSNTSSIVIKGDSMDDISKASQKINSIIYEAAKSPALPYSHFISFPLAIHPELVDKIAKFQSHILSCGNNNLKDVNETMDENSKASSSGDDVKPKIEYDINRVKHNLLNIPVVSYAPKATKTVTPLDKRIDETLFLKPQRLHLTILMLKLWNSERTRIATDVLQGVSSEINEVLGNQPLFVRLKGLDILRGSKDKAQVVYAPVQEVGDDGRLKRACQIIRDAYVRAGLAFEKDAQEELKLHITLMNTIYRRGKWKKKLRDNSFDARDIMKEYGSEEWGEYNIREAHLSQRFVYDDNGYYHCCTSIPFPGDAQALESSSTPPQTGLAETPVADSA